MKRVSYPHIAKDLSQDLQAVCAGCMCTELGGAVFEVLQCFAACDQCESVQYGKCLVCNAYYEPL